MRIVLLLVVAALCCVSRAEAQFKPTTTTTNVVTKQPFDTRRFLGIEESGSEGPSRKNGFLAAGLSFLVPGLGEYYVGDQIWRGAIFTLLEGGLWYGRLHWTARGDDSLEMFHNWAHTHWSPSRYADSLNSRLDAVGDTGAKKARINDINSFEQINNAEDYLSQIGQPNFTHRLPALGEQQYYELISKYIQYTPGWDDNTNNTPQGSKNYQRHADMRETMNHQYEVADNFLYGIILNHVLSAIDAALLAREHNSSVRVEGQVKSTHYRDGTRGYIPTAKVRVTF
jgi:hypothetical protein